MSHQVNFVFSFLLPQTQETHAYWPQPALSDKQRKQSSEEGEGGGEMCPGK